MGRLIDYSGKKINDLSVIKRHGTANNKCATWLCICDCGNEIVVGSSSLTSGQKSCRECYNKRNRTHGLTQSKEYYTWEGMKARCGNKNNPSYKDYGGRGVCVTAKWLNSFETFLQDMGLAPSKDHSIERVDVNGNYCKENCRWILKKHQPRNRRISRTIIIGGRKKCISEWGEIFGIDPNTIFERMKRGWNAVDAIKTPTIRNMDSFKALVNKYANQLEDDLLLAVSEMAEGDIKSRLLKKYFGLITIKNAIN